MSGNKTGRPRGFPASHPSAGGVEIFVLHHVHTFDDDEEDVKLIGVYSTRERAQEAIKRTSKLPGFCDAPEGFSIDPYILDEYYWAEGYITVDDDDE